MSVVSIEADKGRCRVSGKSFSCSIPALAVGETTSVRTTYKVAASDAITAPVTCASASDADGNSANACAPMQYLPAGGPPR
jgi:hypothetical protein